MLEDESRGGRPPTHPPEVRSALVGLATQKPRSLGLPFEENEIQAALEDARGYWNEHRRPYRWRKVPGVLPTPPLGGFGSVLIRGAA